MVKLVHEVRDPIHVFVRHSSGERSVIDSRPFQRLRNIHQLALSYLVYPGATHRRFEHSLGVMELAGRVFDVVTRQDAVTDKIRDLVPEINDRDNLPWWRTLVRMAALCHDIGHLPFSHAAEKELLPSGWTHERLTKQFILSGEMRAIWEGMRPPLQPDAVAKLAVGPAKAPEYEFSTWETILSEIIVGDGFGVDRIDYLLRDSLHTGVGYGRFDHHRLIDTLRILPPSPSGNDGGAEEPALGIEEGGIHSAEALLWARYFMYSQVYYHPVRLIYDRHLQDFLTEWLPTGRFSTDNDELLKMSDNEVLSAMLVASNDPSSSGHGPARRILKREHFRVLYQRHPSDLKLDPEAGRSVYEAACAKFGVENLRHYIYTPSGQPLDFPVISPDGRVASSASVSSTLEKMPVVAIEYVFVNPDLKDKASSWLEDNRAKIIQAREEE